MDFDEEDALAPFRTKAEAWAARWIDLAWVQAVREGRSLHHNALHALLAGQGILGAGWPAEYGGTGFDPLLAQAIFDEIEALGMRSSAWANTQQVLNTVLRVGTEDQKRELVSAAVHGQLTFALGFSEPGCGSDAAAVRTRAVRDGDTWCINGAKMFTSSAHATTHVMLLTRTNMGVAKHKGLTVFLVPLDSPGTEICEIRTLGGERTNATFYTDVAVPDTARLGDVDGGWRVMRVTLVYERTGSRRLGGPPLSQRIAAWASEQRDAEGRSTMDSPVVREKLARIAIDEEISRLLSLQTAWVSAQGELPRAEGAIAKLYTTQHAQDNHADLIDMLGLGATLKSGSPGAILDGELEQAFRSSVVTTIYGGASEILRDLIAEIRLGLPRSRPVG
jgi:alkylation response protein AidB-like acyl-CoA dehydrogenase